MPRKITDPYEVLGLDRGATEADVRTAYLRLAKKHHPDKNPEIKPQSGSSRRFRGRMRPSEMPIMSGRRDMNDRHLVIEQNVTNGNEPSVPASGGSRNRLNERSTSGGSSNRPGCG